MRHESLATAETSATTRVIHPFVGTNYATTGLWNRKVMILGESSYDAKATQDGYDAANQTIHLGHDAIGYPDAERYWNRSRFYTRIARIFDHDPRSLESRKRFWNAVLYYNYLQVVLSRPRQQPPAAAWLEAQSAFRETLEEHRPDVVIAFSNRMWSYLPKDSDTSVPNDVGTQCRTGQLLISDGHKVKLIGFHHPTAYGFRWQPVRELVHMLLLGGRT
ncbi:hypothetical protein [Roseimicrobium sp. ORNL1]|uniref:hypothetical protein n=1 Tax=Roseimicrobium sp. ORNL1 TaxID=2711231 RepID=UPI0013E19F0C|nr:hypothetical protein [Roseimicrobium sp. ORNL1]QIF01487.1 hypothetical protein G5S37_08110 [Roseimicrobium sp. ORNL1]